MLLPEGRHFQPHSCAAGQRRMQELKLLNEAELKNSQAVKQNLLDPLCNHPLFFADSLCHHHLTGSFLGVPC